jgi:acetyl esterase
MAPIYRRLRLWAWVVRRQATIASLSEAEVIALQARHAPDNAVTDFIFGKVAPGTEVSDRAVPGPAGDITVRIYRPARPGAMQGSPPKPGTVELPLVMNFHGGGFVFGELRMSDWLCSNVAVTVGAVVVSVDYRLAPRHRFPAAVDDCFAALQWAAKNAADLGAGGTIGVMGESAGGNLSAVMCLLARDRGGPAIGHQVLLYPATDMTSVPPATASTPFLSAPEMRAYRGHYLDGADPGDSRVSPLLADDHSGLPPALIQVGEHDPLREDGVRYAGALRAAGVPVRLTEYVGMPHGYLNFPGLCRCAAQALAEICAEQKAALVEPAEADA